ncbi:MAG: terpene cyclase/mutase family protein [Candidatus Niyogibacteria bacterium]|nr:terpene cyclase/mutase family protein [Candidatus Niyogibacteria bacterium]
MPQAIKNNVFLRSVICEIPRLLGQLNRNPSSRSYGSFDRAYWHYRTNDISSARYQEAVLTLTLLYSSPFEGNIYYQDKNILEWINAALNFSCSIQNKDGSFDEWYPYEGSFVATSFVVAALAKVLSLLGEDNIPSYKIIRARLERAADWIICHEESLVLNQTAGSALALLNVFLLNGDIFYKQAAEKKIQFILKSQTKEGWWNEYGGPDAGYLSLTVDYLVKYYRQTDDQDVLSAVKNAISFFIHFLHPNFTVGGEYMSRNTEYLIPSGFAYFSSFDETAKIITAFSAASLELKQGVNPQNLDDRYLCYILYNWLEAGLIFNNENFLKESEVYFQERRFDVFFKEAGIRVIQNKKYYFVVNLRKGGVFRIYSKGAAYFDSALEVDFSGKVYIANALDKKNEIESGPDFLRVRGALKPVQEPLLRAFTMIAFKAFQITLGRMNVFQKLMKKFLRKKMIIYENSTSLIFERLLKISHNNIKIKDVLHKEISGKHLRFGLKSSYAFIPSSKYFTVQELEAGSLKPSEEKCFIEKGKTVVSRTFFFD